MDDKHGTDESGAPVGTVEAGPAFVSSSSSSSEKTDWPITGESAGAALEPIGANPCNMTFGAAIEAMKAGDRVARAGWNGKGMFAYLVPAASYPVQTGAAKAHFGEGSMVPYRPYLALKTVDEDVATWAPSCSDVLADDWMIVR